MPLLNGGRSVVLYLRFQSVILLLFGLKTQRQLVIYVAFHKNTPKKHEIHQYRSIAIEFPVMHATLCATGRASTYRPSSCTESRLITFTSIVESLHRVLLEAVTMCAVAYIAYVRLSYSYALYYHHPGQV